ncbi:hypothetical protein BK140_11845 [Paenibacillus macerans]|nr:hypothetical protein BK140_11845 [Paenibacillus macerans]
MLLIRTPGANGSGGLLDFWADSNRLHMLEFIFFLLTYNSIFSEVKSAKQHVRYRPGTNKRDGQIGEHKAKFPFETRTVQVLQHVQFLKRWLNFVW